MPFANPSNDDEDGAKRPLSLALGVVAVLMFAAALVGGVVLVLRYGIGAPLLRASRGMAVGSDVTDKEPDPEVTSETAMTILPFEPDAGATQAFPLPEEFAKLLDPIDAASAVVRTEEPPEPATQEQPSAELEKARPQMEAPPKEAPPKEEPEATAVASEPLTPTPSQADEEPLPEPEIPAPAAPDYWVIAGNARRPPIYVGQGNVADQRPLVSAGFGQLGSPPAPMFTTPPAPMFTTPPAPMFTTPPAPGLTTPPAPMFTTPPAPGFTSPPAPGFTSPPAPGFTTPPAPGFTTPPAPGFTTPPAPGFTTPPAPGFTTPPAPGFTTPPAPGFATPGRQTDRPSRSRR